MKMNKSIVSATAVEMLEGLSAAESIEFHDIDASAPYGGLHVWPTHDMPIVAEEQRWLELWHKHQAAIARRAA
jgi:hypothetical protein